MLDSSTDRTPTLKSETLDAIDWSCQYYKSVHAELDQLNNSSVDVTVFCGPVFLLLPVAPGIHPALFEQEM